MKSSDFLKGRAFLDELNDYSLLKNQTIPRNQTKKEAGIRHVSKEYGPAHFTFCSNTATRAKISQLAVTVR
jgi:hypothetical protein